MAKKLFVKSDSREFTASMDASAEVAFIDEISGFEGIRAGGHTYQTIPDGGTNGQVLTKQDGIAVWKDAHSGGGTTVDTLDLLTYGIKWPAAYGDPTPVVRIGNMEMHKTLPIQSAMKGCVCDAKTGEVKYWLNQNDWRFRQTPFYCKAINPANIHTDSSENYLISLRLITTDNYNVNLRDGQYIGIDVEGQVVFGRVLLDQDYGRVVHIEDGFPADRVLDFLKTAVDKPVINVGSVLDGSDGDVMVYVPEFYIKSGANSSERWVRISPTKIDDSWEHQPAVFVGAYRDSVYPTLPGNPMSGLFVSACNSACEGGSGGDSLNGDPDIFKNTLNKPKTYMSRADIRKEISSGERTKRHIMSYRQYKNILYWLPVIEYATFNLQQNFSDELTSEGFHTGGLGKGITNVTNWETYSNFSPICPNGYTNYLCNNSGEKLITPGGPAPVRQVYANRYRGIENPYGDLYTIVDGILIDTTDANAIQSRKYGAVYTSSNPNYYLDERADPDILSSMIYFGYIPNPLGHVIDWKVQSTSEILPSASGENLSGTYGVSSQYIGTGSANNKTAALGGCADSGMGGGPGLFSVDFDTVKGMSPAAGWRAVIMP